MNYYRRWVGDYLKKTSRLSMLEHGAYTVMLDYYYAEERPLPAELDELYRLVRAMLPEERRAVDKVLFSYFDKRSDGYHNARADEEIEKGNGAIAQMSSAGKNGASAKWGDTKNGGATRSKRLAEARAKGTHTEDEWMAVLAVCGWRCVKCRSHASELIGGVLCKDHVTPIYQGGDDSIGNIQPMCRSCNSSKGPENTDRRPDDWRERLEKCLAERLQEVAEVTPISSNLQPPTSSLQPPTATLASSAEALSPVNGNAVSYIPLNDGTEYGVSKSFAEELAKLYPAVDVPQTLNEIRGYNLTHKAKRKTRRGIEAHINTWMSKEQNRGPKA